MNDAPRPGRTTAVTLNAYDGTRHTRRDDAVATEEPLELRLSAAHTTRTLAVTMRTPGNDFELAAGFLLSEGVVGTREEIAEIAFCIDPSVDREQRYNIVTIALAARTLPDTVRLERHFVTNSACGVCGRAALDALDARGVTPLVDDLRVPLSRLHALPERMRASQRVFAATGGLHAATLFTPHGDVIATREDVGRHNALDKLVGWGLLEDRLPFGDAILLLSGRASYELLHKAAIARIPVVASVSAPSSLAIELAKRFNITLVGFLREGRANVYAGFERIEDT